MKTKGRHLERLYRKSHLTVHKEMYNNHILHYKDTIAQSKSVYHSSLIINKGNTESFFNLLNKILQPPNSLPPHLYSADTCVSIMQFFNDEAINIFA